MTVDEHAKWYVGLKSSGLYKEGVIDGSHLESLLEAHRRETACTFGSRRSFRTSTLQRHCKLPTPLFLDQLSLTVIPM